MESHAWLVERYLTDVSMSFVEKMDLPRPSIVTSTCATVDYWALHVQAIKVHDANTRFFVQSSQVRLMTII